MAGHDSGGDRYTAFLSYSHKDASAAGRLHRRLEAYRMPRRLAGAAMGRGAVPERLWPIFRDREELPAATDLSETVRAALAQSGSLIILCSPHSAGSLWVAEEIETFRALHPDRPILAAILDGDPPDCFPAALRAFGRDGSWHEPLATDLRRHRDGARLGLLKLVAGVTGVGLDDLVQRDATRRVRRVTAVTALAVIAMLIMAALVVVAVSAQREAERQRAEAVRERSEAEGLVEFMLTDLRVRLRASVGQLDIMEAVNRRALIHYGGQRNLSQLPSDSLARRARILQAIAEDEVLRGDMSAALNAAREAYRTTAAQLASVPDDRERLFYHAQSEYWVGRVYELRGNWAAALPHYVRYAQAADRLIASAPHNADYMMEVAWSAQNLGTARLEAASDFDAAQRLYEKAARWFGSAARARPRDDAAPISQANAYAWLADAFFSRNLWRLSLEARLKQFRILDRLHRANPANIDIGYRFAAAQNGLARSLEKVGDHAGAHDLLLQAYAASRLLTQRDPGNGEWLYFRTLIQCEFYVEPGARAGPGRRQLARDILAGADALESRHDPRAASLQRCVNALN